MPIGIENDPVTGERIIIDPLKKIREASRKQSWDNLKQQEIAAQDAAHSVHRSPTSEIVDIATGRETDEPYHGPRA